MLLCQSRSEARADALVESAEQTISMAKYEVTGRGGKRRELLPRGPFVRVVYPSTDAPRPFGE